MSLTKNQHLQLIQRKKKNHNYPENTKYLVHNRNEEETIKDFVSDIIQFIILQVAIMIYYKMNIKSISTLFFRLLLFWYGATVATWAITHERIPTKAVLFTVIASFIFVFFLLLPLEEDNYLGKVIRILVLCSVGITFYGFMFAYYRIIFYAVACYTCAYHFTFFGLDRIIGTGKPFRSIRRRRGLYDIV